MKAALLLIVLLAGCAIDAPKPEEPLIRSTVHQSEAPVVAPCFTEAERPVQPLPTLASEAEIAAATPEQLAAAERADALAMDVFANTVDALFLKCQKGTAP